MHVTIGQAELSLQATLSSAIQPVFQCMIWVRMCIVDTVHRARPAWFHENIRTQSSTRNLQSKHWFNQKKKHSRNQYFRTNILSTTKRIFPIFNIESINCFKRKITNNNILKINPFEISVSSRRSMLSNSAPFAMYMSLFVRRHIVRIDNPIPQNRMVKSCPATRGCELDPNLPSIGVAVKPCVNASVDWRWHGVHAHACVLCGQQNE